MFHVGLSPSGSTKRLNKQSRSRNCYGSPAILGLGDRTQWLHIPCSIEATPIPTIGLEIGYVSGSPRQEE